MVTLVQLGAALGPALLPVTDAARRAVEITGVHISELVDPAPYLEGGELLLTTGMPLTGSSREVKDYVQRIVDRGVGALVLGLGPSVDEVPQALPGACAELGMPLLVVPADQPFITVTRGYWHLVAASGRAGLVAQLGTQTALVREAAKPDGVIGVVSLVAQALGGWAAYVSLDGSDPVLWPATLGGILPGLREEVRRFARRGDVGAATFPLHGYDVIAHPVGTGERLRGAFAVGAARRLSRTDKQIILTAAAVLELCESARSDDLAFARATAATTTTLLIDGEITAAHALAATGGQPLPTTARVFVGAPGDGRRGAAGAGVEATLVELARRGLIGAAAERSRPALAAVVDGASVIVLSEPESHDAALPPDGPPDLGVRGAISEAVRLNGIPHAFAAAGRRAREAAPGEILSTAFSAGLGPGELAAARLAGYTRAPLVDTVRSYLRNRGSWEATARELGVHRNTIRNRVRVIHEGLGLDLDDPDLGAELWIALRERR